MISGEKSLNCELICISVHINEHQTYEYSYIFCCLIKSEGTEGGRKGETERMDSWQRRQRSGTGAKHEAGAIAVTTVICCQRSGLISSGETWAHVRKFNQHTRSERTSALWNVQLSDSPVSACTHHWRSRTEKNRKERFKRVERRSVSLRHGTCF